jgi:cellulose synthase/poly-beta-1,6-N-acetylglucosamine synthase-like glycosyltransferase
MSESLLSVIAQTATQSAFLCIFALNALITLIFLVRQITFSIVAIDLPPTSLFSRVQMTNWPTVTVLVAAYNEELVLGGCLEHLLLLDYPADKLQIIVVNDRSADGTLAILDGFVARAPDRLRAIHRLAHAVPGKPAALAEAFKQVTSELVVFFDADYLPHPPLLRKLVAPFIDPEVAATMGRVVPYNTQANLLTRLLDLERRGGYAVDQAVRSAWNLLPQFGGTVGGVRMAALEEVGGWTADTLAEDTDLTYRLFAKGYVVEYVDDAMCFEESPAEWRVRYKQIRRWACGHNQCLFRYLHSTLMTPHQPMIRKLDAALVLLFFMFPAVSLLGLAAAMIYPTLYAFPPFNFAVISAFSFVVAFGNFSPYFQVVSALVRDRQPSAVAMLPLIFLSSAISMIASTEGLFLALRGLFLDRHLKWDKTTRFREPYVDALA